MLPGVKITWTLNQLPATVSAASTTAITAVAVPASATAAPATPTAPSPASPSTAEAATAAPAGPASSTFSRRPGFVDDNVTTHKVVAVQSLDGALGFLVAIDLDKSEPAWLPRKTVAHQGDIRRGDSRLSK
jgi:hypothetical protein